MAKINRGQKTDIVNGGNLRIEYGKNRLVATDGTDERLLIGEEDSGDIVVKLSKPGYDVKEASDSELIMSSEFNSFKIVDKVSIVVTKSTNSNFAQTAYVHGLGVSPMVVGTASPSDNPGISHMIPYTRISSTSLFYGYTVAQDATQIICGVNTDSVSSVYANALTVTFNLNLLVETAT